MLIAVKCHLLKWNKFWNEYVLKNVTNMYSLGTAAMALAIPLLSNICMSADN